MDPVFIGWTPRAAAADALGKVAPPDDAAVEKALEALAADGRGMEPDLAWEALDTLRKRR